MSLARFYVMFLSQTAKYAITALSYLAEERSNGFVLLKDISHETGVPGPYLSKIFGQLVRHQLLASIKGPAGGYALSQPPERINLYEIVRILDGPLDRDSCLLGLPHCDAAVQDGDCPVDSGCKFSLSLVRDQLEKTTLADLTPACQPLKK